MIISVCCNTFNGSKRVENLLFSIKKWDDKSINMKLVLLDDGSTNINSRNELKKMACDNNAIFIQNDSNLGISKSWNKMCYATNSDIIVLLNDDILVNKDWLKNMVFFLLNNDNIGASSWNFYSFIDEDIDIILNSPEKFIPRDLHTKQLNYDLLSAYCHSNNPHRCMCPAGCCFALTREKYDLSGGFPDDIHSFFEESHLGTMLASKGYASYILPYPPLYHMWSKTFSENFNILKPNLIMGESKKWYEKYWGGNFDYTHPKFMKSIPICNMKWLADNKIYDGPCLDFYNYE